MKREGQELGVLRLEPGQPPAPGCAFMAQAVVSSYVGGWA